jgi:PAS domain-containing protein
MSTVNQYLSERSFEEVFRTAVEACPSGMMMVDHDGKVMMVNTEIERQFGFSAHASGVARDEQVNWTLCKANSSLDDLAEKVRDRLALTSAKAA